MAALSLVVAVSEIDTQTEGRAHPRAKTLGAGYARSVDRQRVFAARIAGIRSDAGWSYDYLGEVLDMARQDAKRLCEYGKATAEQLATVMARAPRRAA